MQKVTQTKYSVFNSKKERLTYGNCLVACLASILEMPIDEIPNIYTFYGLGADVEGEPYWHYVLNGWLKLKFGLSLDKVEINPKQHTDRTLHQRLKKGSKFDWVIARGLSARGLPHCIVIPINHKNGAWDPHPSREGLKEIHYYWKLTKA